VTQDDLLYRFRPRVFAIAAELGTVRAACRAMGIHPWTYYRWKRQLHRHGPEILAQAPAATCRCRRLNGRRCAFSPPPRSLTWPRPFMPATGHWCSWAPTAPADRGAGRAPPKPGRSAGRGGHRGRDLTEVKGKLIAGPPKTRAGRRTVGLPPFVVRGLEEHLAAAQRPGSHGFTAAGGGRCGSRAFGRALGCRLPRQPACRACASTTSATPPWRCGSPPARRPRRSPCAGHTSVSFTLDRYGPQTIPQPVAGGRCHPVRD
jgi:hypothetical protein